MNLWIQDNNCYMLINIENYKKTKIFLNVVTVFIKEKNVHINVLK